MGIPLPSRVKVGKNRSTQTDFLRLMDLGLALVNLSNRLDFDDVVLEIEIHFFGSGLFTLDEALTAIVLILSFSCPIFRPPFEYRYAF